MAVLLADRDDLAQDLGVEAVGLGLGIDFLDVAGDRLLLLLQPLDALDEALELALARNWSWYPCGRPDSVLVSYLKAASCAGLASRWYLAFQSS